MKTTSGEAMPCEKKEIRPEEIKNDRPLDQLFTEALIAYCGSDNQNAYPVRTVAARQVRIPQGFEARPENLAIMRRDFANFRKRHETGPPIAVVERSDGSLWTCDDVHLIALYHESASAATVRVVIIGHDPTPVTVAQDTLTA